ncbi:MAG: hypothetical protein KJ943_00055, partial [Alphaproteobacteria bacterium]|nr:hypothetical protein [Alphaproteobacteria bacterium]
MSALRLALKFDTDRYITLVMTDNITIAISSSRKITIVILIKGSETWLDQKERERTRVTGLSRRQAGALEQAG